MLYGSDVGSSQTQSDIIQTSLDVLSLAIPATQFTKLGRVLFYADKISSVSSMAGTAFREDNPALAEFFNKTSLITGGISAVDLVVKSKYLIKSPINDIIKSEYLADAGKVEKATDEYADFVLKNLSTEQLSLLSKDTRTVIVKLLEKDLSAFSKMDNVVLANKIEKAIDKIKKGDIVVGNNSIVKILSKPEFKVLKDGIDELGDLKVKFLDDFANATEEIIRKIQDENVLEIWKKYGASEKLSIDDLMQIKKVWKQKFRGNTVDFDTFEGTMQYNSTIAQRAKAFELWGAEKWDDLFDYFHANPNKLINGGWPPYDGFYKIEKTVTGEQIKTEIGTVFFDRFQTKLRGEEQDMLGGGFASPVKNSAYNQIDNVFTYDARALMDDLEEGTYYFKFRLKNSEGVTFDVGPAIPWKTKAGKKVMGGATQVRLKGMKFSAIEDKIDIIQQSRLGSGKNWTHLIEDTRESVKKVMNKNIDCN
ncbi:hypothetical protein [Flavobacterium davisii]|uniref:Uncharacterized protein n=1 Tax=Flavobacterium columnare TaxID=996 RepID=A0A8G0P5X5_9FLAO|nr:hypothetical protein [Flavobacterium davisii]QYS89476.1 hypothetical protein JJC05_04140 [Flavobacterium davisii]